MFGALMAYAGSEIKLAARKRFVIVALYAVAGFLTIAAASFALGAARTRLAMLYGDIFADLIVAGALIGLALIFVICAVAMASAKQPKRDYTSAALIGAPIALRLVGAKRSLGLGALAGIILGGAYLGRKLGRSDET